MKPASTLIFLFALLSSNSLVMSICTTEKGDKVDWFIALRIHSSDLSRIYLILDSSNKTWRKTNEASLLKAPLALISDRTHSLVAWNDQHPVTSVTENLGSISAAHSKGFLAMEKSTSQGFYLSHTVPKFPQISPEGEISHITPPGSHYGQNMVCVSLTSNSKFMEVYQQLLQSKISIYYSNLPTKSLKRNPTAPALSLTVGDFTLVTKPQKIVQQVFEDFLTPFWSNQLETGFFVETWGRPLLPSTCDGPNPIINVLKVRVEGFEQKETQDHSKWAVSTNKTLGVVCLGDLNHQSSQRKRGGSFLCMRDPTIYSIFRSMIAEVQCPGTL